MSADQLHFDSMENPDVTQLVVIPHVFPRESSLFIKYDTEKLSKTPSRRKAFLIKERRTLGTILSALGVEEPDGAPQEIVMTPSESAIHCTVRTTQLGKVVKAIAKNRFPDSVPADSAPFSTIPRRKKQKGNDLASGL